MSQPPTDEQLLSELYSPKVVPDYDFEEGEISDEGGSPIRSGSSVRVFRSTYKASEARAGNEDVVKADNSRFDFIFIVAHGASFSSKLLEQNLKDFLKTLEFLKTYWFWELKIRIHVELIDWKSVMSPYQNSPMNRVMPKAQLDDGTPDEQTPSLSNWMSFLNRSKSTASATDGVTVSAVAAETALETDEDVNDTVKTPMVTVEKETTDDKSPSQVIAPPNVSDFEAAFKTSGPRVYFNNTVADVLCYLTPRYGDFLVDQMAMLINKKVRDLKEDPSGKFSEAKVVLVGHSLGTVLLYEILTGLPVRSRSDPNLEEEEDDEPIFPGQTLPPRRPAGTPNPTLDFPVEHFFMWGSPLAAFMILANRKHLNINQDKIRLPTKIYNMFHRQDPVALRLEPLVYPALDKLPPPVTLPSFKSNSNSDPQMAIKKSVDAIVSGGEAIRQMASNAWSKMFSKGDHSNNANVSMVPGLSDKATLSFIESLRYDMPDSLSKKTRYGTIFYVPKTQTQASGNKRSPQIHSMGSQQLFLSRTLSEPEAHITDSSRHNSSGSFEVAKGDAATKQRSPFTTRLKSIDRIVKARHLSEAPRPWTARQLSLSVAVRLRTIFSKYFDAKIELKKAAYEKRLVDASSAAATQMVEGEAAGDAPAGAADASKTEETALMLREKISGLTKPQLRTDVLEVIEDEVQDFLHQTIKATRTKDYLKGDTDTWKERCKMRDLKASEDRCKRELLQEMKNEVSETELAGGDQLPKRMDFVISEQFHEFIFAPWGILASHLNYWNCRETGFFILKQITGFRPRLMSERRDQILEKAQICAQNSAKKIDAILDRY
eukprot:Blabericola_migrator_1__565@NODE_113_length_13881_cov_115_766396_g101_i0_p3_GENE_NODE_113_length_13881_cov_115_766396_g101_i0NODE_113_length_13881_cov_115_766396_g101_i0_p3_ORF_typecomplete_len829_score168_77DDHD/PF02862_17/1_4e29Abhydrolase_6/PF12697_7/0_0079Ser_hydrolase/PF06821_13/1_5e03Ser_hydrolase/PF06821_13/0_16LIDHydrolase/PF10230_9/0_04Lipase_3/PF01764_25/0_27DUF726/PF05277_12/0_13DUF676/PF05057_14/0_37DUF676/PF05057_14/7_5e03BAT2_N/PF07001_11/6_4e03BAT2_N/PF07001_11/0_05_NODE_113_lengt